MSESDRLLAFAMELCDEADRIALRHFRRDHAVTAKPDRSLVTEADTGIEKMLRERIEKSFPSHGVLGEELGNVAGDGETRWIIDPIDSTSNFVRGIPVFATLLALERAGEVQLGVISAPAMRERWHARRGAGAWSGNRRLSVSQVATLKDAQVFYASRTAFQAVGREQGFDAVIASAWRDRGFGDFWGYALVAEGTGEAMIEPELYPWDLAAPLVLVEEAGGRLTDFEGRRTYDGGNAVATNGLLHDVILEKLRSHLPGPARSPHQPPSGASPRA
jgi:histidinol-phosphatase